MFIIIETKVTKNIELEKESKNYFQFFVEISAFWGHFVAFCGILSPSV